MKTQILLATLLLSGAGAYAADTGNGSTVNAAAAFARLKLLVGEWQGDTQMGKATLSYELIAGGSALVERFAAEKEPVMLTVYHFDGKRLILTHYCSVGNQPRMQAQAFNPQTGELEFRYLDATNLTGPGAGHMHNAKLQIVDQDHLVSNWQFYEDGKQKFDESAKYTRVK